MPTRELFWQISNHWLIYPAFLLSLIFLVYGLMKRIKLWRLGQPDQRWNALAARIGDTLVELLGHRKILRDKFPGLMHLFIFWGFLVLTIGTAIVALQADFHINTLYGTFYLILSLAMDLAGLVAIIGILMAVYRRYIVKPDRLDNNLDDGVSLALILVILVSGFIVEGLRIIGTNDPWAVWSPVGNFFAAIFAGLSPDGVAGAFQFFWWTHFVLAMFFIGYLPYSKLFHIITGTLNIAAASDKPAGHLALIDLEDESIESYGVNKIEEFTWKQLLDEDACTRCGRCQDNCPAYLSEKPLSPKRLTQDLKQHLNNVGPALVQKNTPVSEGVSQEVAAAAANEAADDAIIGATIEEETIWSCTTCRSCMEQCPVKIEHVPKIVDMRRYLVLTESSFAPEVQLAFRNMENNSNPWGVGWAKRAEWADGLDIKTLEEDKDVEYLYWVGCAGSFDDRNKKVSKSVVSILRQAGISFGILGTEEKCCGDSARRLGNEYLYQSLAMENIETLNGYGVKKIITHCPHCFNTLKNDYPQMGGNYEVIHHTELINHLMKQGKLQLKGGGEQLKLAYHDSCYLGRYNNIYEAPREVLQSIPGISIAEMERNHATSFCCGAGGGRMWMEEKVGKRINIMRSEQALALQPQAVATNCPFCLAMFEDGVKSFEQGESIKVLDLAEIVAEALEKN